ncbi:ParA family protein [Planctomycetota bacterium]
MFTITFANLKGGVGKSTAALSLAEAICLANKRVVIIDLDPEARITAYLQEKPCSDLKYNHLARNPYYLEKILIKTGRNMSLAPGNPELFKFKDHLIKFDLKIEILKKSLGPIARRFDYCIIDTAPEHNLWLQNAICTADLVIIPTTPDYFAEETIKKARKDLGLELTPNIFGKHTTTHIDKPVSPAINGDKPNCIHTPQVKVLLVDFDPDSRIARKTREMFTNNYSNNIFSTTIPNSISLAKRPTAVANSLNQDLFSHAAFSFINLAKEIFDNEKGKTR